MFSGKRIGKRLAKRWDASIRTDRNRCLYCHDVQAGNHDELMNHYRNRHADYYAEIEKARKELNRQGPQYQVEAA